MYRYPAIKFTPKLKPESVFSGAWSKSWSVKKFKKDSAYLDQQVLLLARRPFPATGKFKLNFCYCPVTV